MRKLTNWLDSFLDYASSSEAPLDCLYWTGVVTVAGALRRNVWIDMGHFRFCCNHFVVLVAPPGVIGKTTTADLGINLLRAVPGIKFGPDVVTWQSLAKSLAESKQADDLGQGAFFEHCSFTLASGEMGNLINPQDREMMDFFVAMWDAREGTFIKETKGSGRDEIVNPWVNMIACTTPAWIAGTFPEYAIGGGFTSRCIFVFADEKRQLIAYPSRRSDPAKRALREALIHDLEQISEIRGQYRLTREAMEWGEEWYVAHHTTHRQDIDPVRFGGYMSRKQGHIHKLAMVLTAAQGTRMEIDLETLQAAEKLVSGTEENMHRVFELIGRSPDSQIANVILELLLRSPALSRNDVHAALIHRLGGEEVSRGIASLEAAGKIAVIQEGDKATLRAIRPSQVAVVGRSQESGPAPAEYPARPPQQTSSGS